MIFMRIAHIPGHVASILLVAVVSAAGSDRLSAETPLWPDGAPGARGSQPADVPTLTPFFPAGGASNIAAVVICPGGGYGGLASHEGRDYALFLNEMGVAGFVLKYRLGSAGYRHPAMMQDVQRAIRLVRANAPGWGIASDKIGVMGSSAGGHLASTALTHFDDGNALTNDVVNRAGCRPDFGILCYPVITMGQFTHGGSRNNLLGNSPPADLIELLSNEKQVTAKTPPTFVWHTADDRAVSVQNSLMLADALNRANVPFESHVYQHGSHGLGLGTKNWDPSRRHPWTVECSRWLRELGMATPK